MNAFAEKDGTTSGRKILLYATVFVFVFSVIGFLFGLPELPTSYVVIIAGVFSFYFTKNIMSKIKLKTDE